MAFYCTCVHVCVGAHMWGVWTPEDHLGCPFSGTIDIIVLDRSLRGLELTKYGDWLVSEAQWSAWFISQ